MARILIVDDEPTILNLLNKILIGELMDFLSMVEKNGLF